MNVYCTCYFNTGFNLLDRPASVSVLDTVLEKETVTLFINQVQGLSSIKLPFDFSKAKRVDYIQLSGLGLNQAVYYVVVSPPIMENNGKTAVLYIKEDYLLTLGISQMSLISGRLNAGHVPSDDWNYFTIPETRFEAPGILELEESQLFVPTSSKKTVMQSSIGITQTADNDECILDTGSTILQGLAAGDEVGNVAVAVPLIKPRLEPAKTVFKLKKLNADGSTTTVSYTSPFYGYLYGYSGTIVSDALSTSYTCTAAKQEKALNFIRSLGLYDSITSFYDIDNSYIQSIKGNVESAIKQLTKQISGGTTQVSNHPLEDVGIESLEPIWQLASVSGQMEFERAITGYTVQNKKCFAGSANAYTLINKATGNSMTLNPEDIKLSITQSEVGPLIIITADLRAGGAPKAFFKYMNGGLNTTMIGVNGMMWGNHQTNFMGQYGTDLANNQYKLSSNNLIKQGITNLGNTFTQGISAAASMITGGNAIGLGMGQYQVGTSGAASLGGSSASALRTAGRGNISSGVGSLTNGISQMINQFVNVDIQQQEFNYAKAQLDYANALDTMATKAPIIEFPYSESSRDLFGNGFTLYRTHYNDEQVKAMDKFYTMWGYQLGGIEVSSSNLNWFSNRQYFNYISMTDVSVKNTDIAMFEREGVAADLANVRLWKVLPGSWNYSLGNPIVSN